MAEKTVPANALVRVSFTLDIPGSVLAEIGVTGHTDADYDHLVEFVEEDLVGALDFMHNEPDYDPDIA